MKITVKKLKQIVREAVDTPVELDVGQLRQRVLAFRSSLESVRAEGAKLCADIAQNYGRDLQGLPMATRELEYTLKGAIEEAGQLLDIVHDLER